MPPRKQQPKHHCLQALLLIAGQLPPSTAKRFIMSARVLGMIDDAEAKLAIAALNLDNA